MRELTKVMDRANDRHYQEMLRIEKYVLDTKTLGLRLEPKVKNKLVWNIIMWSDSDWGTDKDNRKSISGMVLFVNGVLVA